MESPEPTSEIAPAGSAPLGADGPPPPSADNAPAPTTSLGREAWDFGVFLLQFALLMFVLRSFLFSTFSIPSESMQPRLLIGDYLIVNKAAYGYTRYSLPFSLPILQGRWFARQPAVGDVVVFKAPPGNDVEYIKRVIGLPGDRVQVVDGVVHINGRPVPRRRLADLVIPVSDNMVEANFGVPCFQPVFERRAADGTRQCHYPQYQETLPNGVRYNVLDLMLTDADTTGVYQVPEGHLFLMGDNRDRSYDSRFPAVEGAGIGIVPQDNLVGEALVTVFSTDGSARWYNPVSWFSAARWHRIGQGF
ncbi:MAG: signal peptidase I [Sphingopyxis sp.]